MEDIAAARRDAIHRLCVAQARHELSVDAFQQRLALVTEALSTAAVLQLVADLDSSGYEGSLPEETELPAAYGLAPESLRLSSVLTQTERVGRWAVPQQLETKVIFGELVIDFRDAWFEWDLVEIEVDVSFGQLRLVVPPGTAVENEVSEMFGGVTHILRGTQGGEPSGVTIHLAGKVMFANIEIAEKRSTPSEEEEGQGRFQTIRGLMGRMRHGWE